MKKIPCLLLGAALLVLLPSCGTSPVASSRVTGHEGDVRQLVNDYLALKPSTAMAFPMSMDEALRLQQSFVHQLIPQKGPRVGYKVGLVTRESQDRYQVDGPVRGVLLSQMLLPNGAEVPVSFGVQPLCEADLIVVVKDRGINKAESLMEVAEHLEEVVAFIELPDSYLATNAPVTGIRLTAANVGARLGVLGGRVKFEPTMSFVDALAEMTIVMNDQLGHEYCRVPARTILDHPLHAVLWLIEDLKRTGENLKAGDMISLGGVKIITPQAGQVISVHYNGLPGGPFKAMVSFL